MPNGPLSSRPPLLALVLIAIALAAGGIAACTFGDAPPTAPPTATPTVAPTATPIPVPTATPTSAPTATPTAAPTATPTAAPTATPTTAPTATPTTAPTATPTAAPTATPTAMPTATPTPAPTATPTPEADERSVLKWLEENRPTLAAAITSLPWVADGIEGIERRGLQELVNLETLYGTEAAPATVNRSWLADGVDEREVSVLQQLRLLATYEETAAGRIVRMPFLDTLDSGDADTLKALEDLARPLNWRTLLRAVVQKPWVADGLDESEVIVLRHLGWITNGSEETALRILAMPFLQTSQPGGDFAESTVSALWTLGAASQETLRAVIAKAWVDDGLDESETAFVEALGRLANRAGVAAVQIAEKLESPDTNALEPLAALAYRHHDLLRATMDRPWVQDGLDESDVEIVNYLNWTALGGEDVALWLAAFVRTVEAGDVHPMAALWALGAWSQDTLRAVLATSWAVDGLEETETEFVRYLGWLAHDSEEIALQLAEMVSNQESPTAADVATARAFRRLVAHPDLFRAVMATPWFEDGLDESEAAAAENLARVADSDELVAPQILEMPFLQTVEPADAAAMRALGHMAAYRPENFQRVMAHPTLSGGISDEWAKVVTVLGGASDSDPDRIDVLLDLQQVRVEERVIDLPLAGTVTLAIIRTEEGAPRSMDLLEHAVRTSEAFMGVPLPTSRVTVHFDETYRLRGAAGVNFGTHVGMLSRFDVDDDSESAGHTGAITVHEVAHYYWRGGSAWVAEGGANMIASISEHARTGQPVDAGGLSCTHAGNIAELENQGRRGVFGCNYAFGHRLLLDLYRALGEDAFREGFRDLYLMSRTERLDISHYKAAFTAVAPERAADIDRIAARWYEGEVAADVLDPDPSPVDPILSSVSGRVQDAYVVAVDGNRRTNFSTRYTQHLWLRLLFSVRAQPEPRELRFTIEGYYEDGFAFWLRDVTVTVPAHQTSGDFQVWRGASSTYQWAPGRYIIYVYHEEQKVAEVQFQFLRIT